MGRKKRNQLELRFYELPQGESVLALLGEPWVGAYGRNDTCLHFHNLFELGYCHFGSGKLLLADRALDFEDAMLSLVPANVPHSVVSEAEASWEFLFFDPEELIREMYPDNPKKQTERLNLISQNALLLQIDAYPDISATAWRILEEERARLPHYQDLVRNQLKVLLLELLRIREGHREDEQIVEQTDPSINQILPALRFIEEHYAQDIRASDLAEQCGLSEPHFRRIFAESIDMSPMEYLNLTRVRKACRLISRKNCSMVHVAAECGFPSVSTFTRNFKRFLGVTPYQWKLQRASSAGHLPEYNISVRKGWDAANH